MFGEQIWTCIQEDRERKETENVWTKRTKTEMLLERRTGWLCGTSCLEVRWEQAVRRTWRLEMGCWKQAG